MGPTGPEVYKLDGDGNLVDRLGTIRRISHPPQERRQMLPPAPPEAPARPELEDFPWEPTALPDIGFLELEPPLSFEGSKPFPDLEMWCPAGMEEDAYTSFLVADS
jgi:hypothetical protein